MWIWQICMEKKTFFNAEYSIFYTLTSCKNNPTNTKGISVVKTTLCNQGVQKSITNPPPPPKNPSCASFFLCHFQNVKNIIANSCHSSLSRKKAYTHKTKPFTPNHQFANSPYHSVYISYSTYGVNLINNQVLLDLTTISIILVTFMLWEITCLSLLWE